MRMSYFPVYLATSLTETGEYPTYQYSGPSHFGVDPDSDPSIFVIDLQDANKKLIFSKSFFLLIRVLFEGTFTSFFKDKKSKRSHRTNRINVFSYYFCLMTEGSGSGSIPLTSGSGSRRLKNMWIRIRNTATYLHSYLVSTVGSTGSQCYPGSGSKFGVRSSSQQEKSLVDF
jgi:hypothetical protein